MRILFFPLSSDTLIARALRPSRPPPFSPFVHPFSLPFNTTYLLCIDPPFLPSSLALLPIRHSKNLQSTDEGTSGSIGERRERARTEGKRDKERELRCSKSSRHRPPRNYVITNPLRNTCRLINEHDNEPADPRNLTSNFRPRFARIGMSPVMNQAERTFPYGAPSRSAVVR